MNTFYIEILRATLFFGHWSLAMYKIFRAGQQKTIQHRPVSLNHSNGNLLYFQLFHQTQEES